MLWKKFLLQSSDIARDSFIWNMAGSMLFAFQSVIMLMILTRVVGLKDAGIFTIAFANANLFLTIGKYGMRSYQVSDVRQQFSFGEYVRSRWVTSLAMIVVSSGYLLYAAQKNSYDLTKSMVILCMCLMKVVDAVEDVYHGFYQQRDRLDVAGKAFALRLAATILIFGLGIILLRDLLRALVIATLCTAALFFLLTVPACRIFPDQKRTWSWKNVWALLRVCFPLAAGQFLSFYITNAPKYAIDAQLTDELQACYGFIAMPVFVIGLLNGFIFNPMLFKMSTLWSEGKFREFSLKTVRQIGVLALITLICLVGAYVVGIPVLSWLYNTDLTPYKTELLILLLGGGFLGLSGFMTTMNAVIRRQRGVMWGYAFVALLALAGSNRVVAQYGVFGASLLYAILMAILCVALLGVFFAGVRKARISG